MLPGVAKDPRRVAPAVTEPKPLPPRVLPKPFVPDASPAKGDALLPPPNVSLGASAGLLLEDLGAAKELSDGAPAAADPKALPPDPASAANGEEDVASLPKPEAANALVDVSGCFFSGDFERSASEGF